MKTQFFNRGEAAEYLNKKGLPGTKSTLAKLACIGGGPKFRKFGRNCVYTAPDMDAYIAARLSGPMTSTSDQSPSEAGGDLPHSAQDSSRKNQHDGDGQAHDDSPAMTVQCGAGA